MAEDEYAKRTGKCLLLNFHGLLMQMQFYMQCFYCKNMLVCHFSDSVRAFKERMKMGRFNPEEQQRREEEKLQREAADQSKIETMNIGDR